MSVSPTEIKILDSIYRLSFSSQKLEPRIEDVLPLLEVEAAEAKLCLRKLAVSGHIVGTKLTAQGKMLVEEMSTEHPIFTEINSFRQIILTELIVKTQQNPSTPTFDLEKFEVTIKNPRFFIEFSIDVLEQKGFIRIRKDRFITIGPVLQMALIGNK